MTMEERLQAIEERLTRLEAEMLPHRKFGARVEGPLIHDFDALSEVRFSDGPEAHERWVSRLGLCSRCGKWKGFPVCHECRDEEFLEKRRLTIPPAAP